MKFRLVEDFTDEIEEKYDDLKQALYLLNGINTYRAEVPLCLIDDGLKKGTITQFPNNNSDMMFQKLKKTFQEYCQEKELPYTSWVNE
jgi:hypothetical protein